MNCVIQKQKSIPVIFLAAISSEASLIKARTIIVIEPTRGHAKALQVLIVVTETDLNACLYDEMLQNVHPQHK